MTPKETVAAFWAAMATNDFAQAAQWLTEDYECAWPQSNELIVGRENFTQINTVYPSTGKWHFTVEALIAENDQVVSHVLITDGAMHARAITFHTVIDGLISRQVEFWPDDYPAPEWRAQWIKKLHA